MRSQIIGTQWYLEFSQISSQFFRIAWWRHQMETFSALLANCAGNSPVTGEFPAQRPVTRSFDAFFDLRLNKRLSEQSWGWWFETLSCPLWRHRNGFTIHWIPRKILHITYIFNGITCIFSGYFHNLIHDFHVLAIIIINLKHQNGVSHV